MLVQKNLKSLIDECDFLRHGDKDLSIELSPLVSVINIKEHFWIKPKTILDSYKVLDALQRTYNIVFKNTFFFNCWNYMIVYSYIDKDSLYMYGMCEFDFPALSEKSNEIVRNVINETVSSK
jgi:hypothetical protein